MEVGGGSLLSTGSNAQRPPQPALPPRTPLRSGPRPALRPRTALPPGPGARPAEACGAVPPPARSRRLPGALQSAHTSARGPFRDILSGDAATALWASVGGAGGGPGRRRRPYGPARLPQGPGEAPRARPTVRPRGWPGTRRARPPARPRAPSAPRRPAPRRPAAARRSPRPLRGPGRSCRKQRRPCPPGEGRRAPRPAAPLRSEAAPLGERRPARRPEWTGALKGAAARCRLIGHRDTR